MLYICYQECKSFFGDDERDEYCNWTCAINVLLYILVFRFSNRVFRPIVGIPMGMNYAHLVADLLLCCNESNFMSKLQKDKY